MLLYGYGDFPKYIGSRREDDHRIIQIYDSGSVAREFPGLICCGIWVIPADAVLCCGRIMFFVRIFMLRMTFPFSTVGMPLSKMDFLLSEVKINAGIEKRKNCSESFRTRTDK